MTARELEAQCLAMTQRLRESREYVGLSQEDVATALGVSRPAITNIESGTRKVGALELDKLAKLYGQSAQFLLTGREAVGSAPTQVPFLARALKGLSPKDMEEVARFAAFLKQSSDARAASKPSKK